MAVIFFWASPAPGGEASPFSPDTDFLISLAEFSLGDLDIRGDFHINRTQGDNCAVYSVSANELFFGEYLVREMEAKIIKKKNQFTITYLKGDNFLVTGKIDFEKNLIDLTANITTVFDSAQVKGSFRGRLEVSGDMYKPWVKGTMFIKDGVYLDQTFQQARLSFAGYLPYLRLNESMLQMYDGSQYRLDGFVNVNDLQKMFSLSQISSKEVSLGEWKVFSGANSMGFAKDIDEHMGVTFGSVINKQDNSAEDLGAEFRYQMGEDKFLKLRMENDRSIVGFEQRNEF